MPGRFTELASVVRALTALARWASPNEKLNRAISFCVVSALLRISSTHFSAPLLRDVTAEVIEQLKERGNLRADCPLSIVDFDAHCPDPGIVFLAANTQRGLQDTRDFFDHPRLQLRVHQTLRRDDARV